MSECCVIAAGEPSGDLLGADLSAELRKLWPELKQYGVVGPQMLARGIEPLGHIEALSVMGFVEVLKHFPFLKMYEQNFLEAVQRLKPRFVVFIDYPGLHMRLAEPLKMLGIPVVQFVAPQLWAWGKNRAAKIGAVTDHVLGIMPFETEFFRGTTVNFSYVGTPQVDRAANLPRDRLAFGLTDLPVIGFFPGSRRNEITKMLPPIKGIVQYLKATDSKVQIVLSLAPSIKPQFFLQAWGVAETELRRPVAELAEQGTTLVEGVRIVAGRSLELMGVSTAALVTSGTATLECALAGAPMAVAYRMHPLSYRIARRVVKVPYISLVNLIASKMVVKEFIQDFTSEEVGQWLLALCFDPSVRQAFHKDLLAVRRDLRGQPGAHAAQKLVSLYHRKA